MQNKNRKLLALILTLAMFICSVNITFAASNDADDISIIYTQDVHCGYLEYDKVAALAKQADLLIDGGDAIEGDLIGTLSKGKYVVDIMNYMGYDVSALGNHEFDFSVPYLQSLNEYADFDYICCNCIDLKTGELVFDPYKIFDVKGKKIAIISVTTPETLSKSNPIYFKNCR